MFSKEDYVSLGVAKLLKEKGFDEPCLSQYTKSGTIWNCQEPENFNESEGCFSMPTLYEAQKWLRDKHNIDIVVEPEIDENTDNKIGYCFDLYTDFPSVAYSLVYETYEEALNAGILEALKLI